MRSKRDCRVSFSPNFPYPRLQFSFISFFSFSFCCVAHNLFFFRFSSQTHRTNFQFQASLSSSRHWNTHTHFFFFIFSLRSIFSLFYTHITSKQIQSSITQNKTVVHQIFKLTSHQKTTLYPCHDHFSCFIDHIKIFGTGRGVNENPELIDVVFIGVLSILLNCFEKKYKTKGHFINKEKSETKRKGNSEYKHESIW